MEGIGSVINNREKQKRTIETIDIHDALGQEFSTVAHTVFTIGKVPMHLDFHMSKVSNC